MAMGFRVGKMCKKGGKYYDRKASHHTDNKAGNKLADGT